VADTPRQFTDRLKEWRKGLRRELVNGAKRSLRPHVEDMRRNVIATTVGRKLWSAAFWTGGPRKSKKAKRAFDKAIAAGGSRIPLIVRLTNPKGMSGKSSTLEIGLAAIGMAALVSEGGQTKTTYLPQLKRKMPIARTLKDKGLLRNETRHAASGFRSGVEKSLSEYTRKVGL
jgi:hypothetical protein